MTYTRSMKIVLSTKNPTPGPLQGTAGWEFVCLFVFSHRSTVREHSRRRRHRSSYILNKKITLQKCSITIQTLTGVSPPPLWLPDAITPEQVLRHHRQAQGRYEGTGTVPSFIVPASWISYQRKGLLQSLKNKKIVSAFC
jgi:hypothetical protein